MKFRKSSFVVMFLMLLAIVCAGASIARADGKQIFLDNKCNKCHEGAGIALLPKDPAAAGEAEEAAEGEKVDPPKLDHFNATLVKDWGSEAAAKEKLPAFLKKEAANGKNRKHKKAFKGAEADLTAVIDWLLSLK